MTVTRRLKIIVDQAGDAASGLGGLAGKLGGLKVVGAAAAGGIATLGGAAFAAGGYLVSLGSDAEEMQGKFDVVFSQTGDQVTKSLDEFGNAVGRNRFELMEYASTFGDTLKPMGLTEQAAADFSVQLTQLGTDLASFNNMPMDEAMQRLQGTLIGSHENALAFGVVINENTLKGELAAQGWDKLTGAELEAAKVQARINLLMKGTSDAQGDAERTSGSWANQMRGLKAELSETATAMGVELLPVVTPLLKDFMAMAKDVLPKAVEIFKQFSAELGDTVGPAILMANDAITRIAQAFGVNTEEVTAGDAALAAFKAVLDAFIIAIQLGAVALQGIAWSVEKVKEAIDIARGIISNFKTIWDAMWSTGGINGVIDRFNILKNAIREAANALPPWLEPGSPTPLELGMRGIANATKDVGAKLPAAFAGVGKRGGAGAGAGASGGSGIIINLTYSPTISTASKYEAESVLAPFIAQGIKNFQAGLI